jgi:hypothetical protein
MGLFRRQRRTSSRGSPSTPVDLRQHGMGVNIVPCSGTAVTDGKQCSYVQLRSGQITSCTPQWNPNRPSAVRDEPLTTVHCSQLYSG